jgi:hypothetical protein
MDARKQRFTATLPGGSVVANSAGLGHGSEFVVLLPLLPASAK